jgi:hypothetical protein
MVWLIIGSPFIRRDRGQCRSGPGGAQLASAAAGPPDQARAPARGFPRPAQAENLSLQDFHCRYLAVDDIWIPLGEALLIEMFAPIWNTTLPGFGNHDPGKGRHNQQRSFWDTLHPGRAWAGSLQPNAKTAAQISAGVARVLATRLATP